MAKTTRQSIAPMIDTKQGHIEFNLKLKRNNREFDARYVL